MNPTKVLLFFLYLILPHIQHQITMSTSQVSFGAPCTKMSFISCTFAGCNFKTSRREYLKKHQNCHQFKCEFCDKVMITKAGWETHLKRHTGELLPCTVCDFKTAYVASLKTHIQMHELGNKGIDWPKRPNTHKCQFCDYLAPSEARIVMHARIHFNDMPFQCSIPGCGYRTKWKGNLKEHEDRHDPMKSTRFKCPMCPKRFCTDYQLARHVRTHTQERTRACPDCDYKAATLIEVRRHQKRHHFKGSRYLSLEVKTEDIKIQRNETDVAAETTYSLREGLRPVKVGRHSQPSSLENSEKRNGTGQQRSSSVSYEHKTLDSSPSKPLDDNRKVKLKPTTGNKQRIYPKNNICSICGFATSRNLKYHMRTHSDDKPFHCQVPHCNFKSKWEKGLKAHTDRLHTPKKYMCPRAGCDFESIDLLLSKKHRLLHKLPLKRNLQCPLCPKKYASKLGLDTHVLCHTGEKAFTCACCEYKGQTSRSIRMHFGRMHAQ